MPIAQTLADAPELAVSTSPEDRKARAKLAAALILQGSSVEPVRHWTQGAARVAQALTGGLELGQISRDATLDELTSASERAALPGLGGGPVPVGPSSMPPPTMRPRPRTAAILAQEEPWLGSNAGSAGSAPAETPGFISSAFQQFEPTQSPGGLPASKPVQMANVGQPPAGIGTPALSGATPAGATPVQTQSITPPPTAETQRVAQATPQQPFNMARGTPQFTPEENAAITRLLRSRDPKNVAEGRKMYDAAVAKANQKPEYNIHSNADGTITAVNKNDPRDVHKVDPQVAQSLIDFKAKEAGATEMATARAKVAVQKESQQEGKEQSAGIVLDNISTAKNQINNGYFVTGLTGSLAANVPGTPAHDLSNTLDTIKANIGFDKLNAMRAASPTGGALGNVTEYENRLLQATFGSVRQSQGTAQLQTNLAKLEQLYKTIIDKGVKPPPGWTPDKPITPDLYKPPPEPGRTPAPAIRQTGAPAQVGGGKPKVGDTEEGWRFKGGDPSKRENWEQAI